MTPRARASVHPLHILVATRLEERDLVARFGEHYRDCRRAEPGGRRDALRV
jgi:hypothetical protein